LEAGDSLGIVGESGSGKTQAMLSLLGLLSKNGSCSGEVHFQDQNLLSLSNKALRRIRGKKIAVVFQDPMTSLNPYLKIGTQMAEVLTQHNGVPKTHAWSASRDALEEVGLDRCEQRLHQYPHELSGGMRQRVAIAMALLCNPDILIADEPTTALDVTVQQGILKLLTKIRQETNTALLFISHDLAVVSQVCDKVLVMRDGECIEQGDVAGVFLDPKTEYTNTLISAIPRLDAKAPLVPETPSNEAALLRVDNVSVKYSVRGDQDIDAVKRASLSLSSGETLGLVGESGSGKSTLARAILGLIPLASGSVTLDGKPLSGLTARERQKRCKDVQMIFQDPLSSLNPRLTIGEIVGEPLLTHFAYSKEEIHERVADTLSKVGLSSKDMHRYPHQYSGGQCQRVAIARAIIMTPKLIVCDEPVSALDVSVQAQVLALLKELQHSLSLSYLFIAHDISVVKSMSQRMLVMYQGEIVESGDSETVCTHPDHPYTQNLIGAVPVLREN
ncbi:MAG: ABC transporter ATP-binding protein, partial [Pseudomonadota bacterium]